ncbi:MAG: class I SAM-dependent methyltransferase family protein [Candidatus Thermoplasmatota archaeon]|nr:class I SAM-dependent methyltransferase family protein [Candidatus Thermoplasmatota archaeon]
MLGAKVGRRNAEELRAALSRAGLLDKKHAIIDDADNVIIPVTSEPPRSMLEANSGTMIEADFPTRKQRRDPIELIREAADIPDRLLRLLPSKWERLGDIGVIRLDDALNPYEDKVAEAYARVLRLKTVLREVGGIEGEFRRPVSRVVFGRDTVTTHLENGIRYRLDVADIMFSSGNEEERIRMAGIRCDDETVVDMFAGIGYFSLPLAVYQKPRKIVACEINPKAHSYLVENIALNGAGARVQPFLGDNRTLAGESFADRVVMGYVKTTHEFLPVALRYLRDGGVLHYHETCPNALISQRPLQRLKEAAQRRNVEVLRFKEIKSYAPGVSHVVLDARINAHA